MTPTLVQIPYSPWSSRSRWALDHAGIPWRSVLYTPTVDEPWLRWKLGQWSGTVSVPVLFAETPIAGSLPIARWVAHHGATGLLPPGVERIDALADQAVEAGRVLAGHRVLADQAALDGSCPPALRPLGPIARVLVKDAWRRILRKYDREGVPLATHTARLIEALTALDEAVGEGPFVFDRFSYADITAASALAFVAPGPDQTLADATRAAWADPELAARFHRLVAWRDALIAARPPSRRIR